MEEDEELQEIQVWNFTVNDNEIDDLIEKLNHLKKTKKQVSFEIDEENELQINHIEYVDDETKDNPKEDEELKGEKVEDD